MDEGKIQRIINDPVKLAEIMSKKKYRGCQPWEAVRRYLVNKQIKKRREKALAKGTRPKKVVIGERQSVAINQDLSGRHQLIASIAERT